MAAGGCRATRVRQPDSRRDDSCAAHHALPRIQAMTHQDASGSARVSSTTERNARRCRMSVRIARRSANNCGQRRYARRRNRADAAGIVAHGIPRRRARMFEHRSATPLPHRNARQAAAVFRGGISREPVSQQNHARARRCARCNACDNDPQGHRPLRSRPIHQRATRATGPRAAAGPDLGIEAARSTRTVRSPPCGGPGPECRGARG